MTIIKSTGQKTARNSAQAEMSSARFIFQSAPTATGII
jgi:hypothetical protein